MFALLFTVWLHAFGGTPAVPAPQGGHAVQEAEVPAPVAIAPSSDSTLPSLRFRRLTATEGLPSSTVHHVMQDRRGFIWLSTRQGVLRYDGRSFVSFQHDPLNPNSPSANTVWVTAEDQRGWIWMGTLGGGLTIYQPTTDRFLRFAAAPSNATALPANTVTALHEDAQGRMWVGTDGGGLSHAQVRPGRDSARIAFRTVQPANAPTALDTARVLDIAETPDGTLWLATYGHGVYRYDPAADSLRAFRHDPARPESLSDDTVMSVALDAHGGVWAGTKFGGLNYIAPSGHVTRVPLRIRGTDVSFVWRVRMVGGTLWAGTYGHGLARLDYRLQEERPIVTAQATDAHDPADPYSLSDDFVLAIFQDRTGVVWTGTENDGLNLFYDVPHVRPLDLGLGPDERPLRTATVTTVSEDSSRLWIGTTEGLFVRSSGAETFAPAPIPDSSAYIERVRPGAGGWLWVCTNHGLYRYHPSIGTLQNLYAALRARGLGVNDRFFDVAEQPDGSVWAATDRGIVALRMEGTTLAEARLLTSINRRLVSTRIRHLSVHRDTTWIGTTGGGLARVAGPEGSVQTLAALLNDPLYATIKVLDVAFDGAAVWAATHGGGVVMLRGDEPPTVFTTADGLPGAIVRDVEVDATGRVWATTDGGLACKPPDRDRFELVPLPVPGIGGVGRMAAVPDGEFFVAGTSRGLFVLNPAAVGAASRPPPVAVTGATVMGRPVRIDPGAASHARPTLHLAPTDDFVSVQFAVLDFAWPPSNQLEYRLATSDAAWQRLGASGTVSFSHLRPGTHNLDVRGRRLMGPWSASPAHVVLEVVPSFWETRWFRAALIMVLLGGVAGGLVLRRRARRRTERLRRRIADDLHDDLGSKISSVTLMLDLVRRDAGPDHASMLKEASATARDVARDLRDAIWIVDASYDTLAAFLNHVRTVASRLSPQQFVHVTIPEEAHAVDLTMEQRRHLLLFVKEAMHNAARHAKATTITVSTRMASGTVTLAVHDDGRGFSRDAITPGRGLQTLQRRADALAGTLTLETDVGEGTTVALSFPTR